MFDSDVALLNRHSASARTLAQRLSVLILLLAAALLTTSCGLLTQPVDAASTNHLALPATIPAGTVNESYNAVLTVGGGRAPYHFSVATGVLPPGISLNPTTGRLSGTPTTTGTYSFEVMVIDSSLRNDKGSQTFHVGIGKGSGRNIKIGLSPASVTLTSNQKHQFTATVSGTSNTGVTWSAATGSIDVNGLYTAPTVSTQTNVMVTATSNADSSKSATSTITVNPASTQALAITTTNLPQGQQGDLYNEVFTATGGTTPYSWTISAGTPPAGVAMNASGDLAGTPAAAGTFNFTVTVTDATSQTASGNFSTTILADSNFDGPAELPRVTVATAMSDTPAPGSVITVNAGGNLQTALNNARCGDVIELQAGATFSGKFIVPAKSCDSSHWIIVRTSAPDSALPAEGQRATPCYAGVASLPGRPQYSCANPSKVMAKVQMTPTVGDGPFQFASGANYYRFIGLEITRPAGSPGSPRLISISGSGGTADHIVVDRSWLHGNPQDEVRNGVGLNGMTYAAVVDSYFNDFHCISGTGTCTDAHAIGGGLGDTQDGPFKIQNNFLEASGESILFGGGKAISSPTDIQILNNHFWKPWQWMPGNPNFIGGPDGHPFIVKNHFELKNAVRVLVDGNLMENTWGGFSQSGYGILLTPRNQYSVRTGTFLCPACQVTDVTIRYVRISHGGGGIQMATLDDTPTGPGQPALAGTRWSIHDVVIDDLSKQYVGGGIVFEIMNGWPTNPLNTVTINHVTGFPDPSSHMIITGNSTTKAPMYGLVFTNNLVVTGRYPVWDALGGTDSCAKSDVPVTVVNTCFATRTFSNNALVGNPAAFPPSTWPLNNLFPATIGDAGFVNFNNGNGGNYELQSGSPYKNKGTDGKDLGADIVGLNAALANVE
ncbi:MAG: Ig domain-containing protein [Acidobacteriia bacterium]|nr:Ig domain-containing protein [Terriglobia bacterium]